MSGTNFEFENVTKTFGIQAALKAVSFRLESDRHTAILGPSGCGKTTVLRLMAGLDAPSAGRIKMNERIASEPNRINIPPHGRGLAMVFQDLALWPNLNVINNVLLALSSSGLSRKQTFERAEEALERCGIADLTRRKPWQLSGGQQQRVALARATASRPDFLLLDEPFAGLDLLTRDHLLDQINQLAHEVGFSVILVTHDPIEALDICDFALVMDHGLVVETGELRTLLEHSQSNLLRRFKKHCAVDGASRRTRR